VILSRLIEVCRFISDHAATVTTASTHSWLFSLASTIRCFRIYCRELISSVRCLVIRYFVAVFARLISLLCVAAVAAQLACQAEPWWLQAWWSVRALAPTLVPWSPLLIKTHIRSRPVAQLHLRDAQVVCASLLQAQDQKHRSGTSPRSWRCNACEAHPQTTHDRFNDRACR
jgi:hypothetical protein